MNDNYWATEQIESLEIALDSIKKELRNLRSEYNEYKEAMEFYIGRGRCMEALEQYRLENK